MVFTVATRADLTVTKFKGLPMESMDDETLVQLSRGKRLSWFKDEVRLQNSTSQWCNLPRFHLSYKDLHDLQQIDKEKRKDVDENIIKYMYKGIAKTHQVGELPQEPIDDALPSQSPLGTSMMLRRVSRQAARFHSCTVSQPRTEMLSTTGHLLILFAEPLTWMSLDHPPRPTKNIEECEMKYVGKIIKIKGATNISSLPWHHTPQRMIVQLHILIKYHAHELKQHGRLAKLLHEQSTACSVVEAHCLARISFEADSSSYHHAVDNYILELYYFKELVEDLIEFSNLTIDKSSVYMLMRKHRLFYGISIAAISLFSKISGQLGLLTDYEQRD